MPDFWALLRTRLLISLLVFPHLVFAGTAADERVNPIQVKEKQHQLNLLRIRMEQVRDVIRNDEDDRDTLVGELRAVEIRVGEISEALHASKQALEALQVRLGTAIVQRDLAAASLNRERNVLRAQIRAAYVLGRQDRLKLLLRQGEPESVGRALVYYDYLHVARGRRISGYTEQVEGLMALEGEIIRHRKQIGELQGVQTEDLKAQQAVLRERQDVLAGLQHRLQDNQDTLRGLERDEAGLRDLVKELQMALRELEKSRINAPFAARRGKLALPVIGEVAVNRRESFEDRVAGVQGLTLVAAAGTEVQAVHGGQVVFADWLKGFGLLLIIDHGDEYLSIYAHNESFYSRVGDWVGIGDVIATVGNSGGQSRAALYFEIRHRGAPLDPLPWFAEQPKTITSHDS